MLVDQDTLQILDPADGLVDSTGCEVLSATLCSLCVQDVLASLGDPDLKRS